MELINPLHCVCVNLVKCCGCAVIKETLCRATELLLFIAYKESEEAFAEGGRNMFELKSSLQLSFLQLELRQLFAGCKHFTGSLLALLQRARWGCPSKMVCCYHCRDCLQFYEHPVVSCWIRLRWKSLHQLPSQKQQLSAHQPLTCIIESEGYVTTV